MGPGSRRVRRRRGRRVDRRRGTQTRQRRCTTVTRRRPRPRAVVTGVHRPRPGAGLSPGGRERARRPGRKPICSAGPGARADPGRPARARWRHGPRRAGQGRLLPAAGGRSPGGRGRASAPAPRPAPIPARPLPRRRVGRRAGGRRRTGPRAATDERHARYAAGTPSRGLGGRPVQRVVGRAGAVDPDDNRAPHSRRTHRSAPPPRRPLSERDGQRRVLGRAVVPYTGPARRLGCRRCHVRRLGSRGRVGDRRGRCS